MLMGQYLHNLEKKQKEFIYHQYNELPIVVNEIINNHVASSIAICPVLTLKSHARKDQLAMKNVLIQNVVKQSAGRR
jgi:hypothetical protein